MTPSAVDKKFYQDTAWNYIAFFIMALTGLILNFFIAWKTGVETLGIFNQIYAIYVIFIYKIVIFDQSLKR